jgi:hypothetical protein
MKAEAQNVLPDLGGAYTPHVSRLIELVVVCSFPERWSDAEVTVARTQLEARYGRVPSLEALAERFGERTVLELGDGVLARRDAINTDAAERLGVGSACHLCAAARAAADPFYHFGLARSVQRRIGWGVWIARIAANVITIPLGVAIGALPGVRTTAQIVRLRLALCSSCARQRRSFFGELKMSVRDCCRHPSWQRMQSAGFAVWIDQDTLAKYKRVGAR